MSIPWRGFCPFCTPATSQIVRQDGSVLVLRDAFPVSKGHTLVVPKLHVASVFDLPDDEYQALWRTVAEVREALQQEFEPKGFNIGVNDGAGAGQTVPHAHIHIIPRYLRDLVDPRSVAGPDGAANRFSLTDQVT